MPRLGHLAEGVGDVGGGEFLAGEGSEIALREQGENLTQQRTGVSGIVGGDLGQINGRKRDILPQMVQPQPLVVVNVSLANFQKTAARPQQRQPGGHCLTGQ